MRAHPIQMTIKIPKQMIRVIKESFYFISIAPNNVS